jgi:transcription antitermination factor NusG
MAKGGQQSSNVEKFTSNVWVAAELHFDVELQKHRQNLEKELNRIYRGAEFYIPVHDETINGKRYFTVLCEGYVYVRYPGTKEFNKMFKEAKGNYVCGPLGDGRGGFAYFSQKYIDNLKLKAKGTFKSYQPQLGDTVMIQHETLEGMEGLVKEVDIASKRATVHIKMRSQEVLAVVPFTNLEPKTDSWEDYLTGY